MKISKLIQVVSRAGFAALILTAVAPAVSNATVFAAQGTTQTGAVATTNATKISNNEITGEIFRSASTGYTKAGFTTPSEFTSIQHYLTVQNNQYVLVIPSGADIDAHVIADAKENLTMANQAVADNGLTINPQTLLATDPTAQQSVQSGLFTSSSTFSTNAIASNSAQNIVYPWGVRSVFRSNAQVNDRVWIYEEIAGGADIVSTAGD